MPPPVPFPGYLDVNASNPAGPSVEPADALLVINALNAGSGEGEQTQTLAATTPSGDAGEGESSLTFAASQSEVTLAGRDPVAAPAWFTAVVDHRISELAVTAAESVEQSETAAAELAWNVFAVQSNTASAETARSLPESAGDLEEVLSLLSENRDASGAHSAHDAFFSEFA